MVLYPLVKNSEGCMFVMQPAHGRATLARIHFAPVETKIPELPRAASSHSQICRRGTLAVEEREKLPSYIIPWQQAVNDPQVTFVRIVSRQGCALPPIGVEPGPEDLGIVVVPSGHPLSLCFPRTPHYPGQESRLVHLEFDDRIEGEARHVRL